MSANIEATLRASIRAREAGVSIYVAGPSSDLRRVRRAMDDAERIFGSVTYDWAADVAIARSLGIEDDAALEPDEALDAARLCREAVQRCDALWLLVDLDSHGSWVELGIAIERQIPIVCSGAARHQSIFTRTLPGVDDDRDAPYTLALEVAP